jgi:hypothetical protein
MINKSIATLNTRRGPADVTVKHLMLVVILLVLVAGSLAAWQAYRAASIVYEPGTMPLSAEIEEKFGVRFTFVAVTAKGGMVELRYRVIDEGKAANFGHYTETAPMLVAEDTGKIVDVTIMGLHNHRVEPGRTYYVLYRNTDNAIESHRPVTIAIGDLKLEHVVAW